MVGLVQPKGLAFDPDGEAGAVEASRSWRTAASAVKRPFYARSLSKRLLSDFVRKDLYAAARNGTPSQVCVNDQGVDSWSAALEDISTTVGGTIVLEDGHWRLPPMLINRSNLRIEVRGTAVLQFTQPSGHLIDIDAPRVEIDGRLHLISAVTRTSGAMLRARNSAARLEWGLISGQGVGTLLQIDGHPSNPALDTGVFIGGGVRAENSLAGQPVVAINGGYLVDLGKVIIIGDPAVSPEFGPAVGVDVTRTADCRVQANSQILNCVRPFRLKPPAGQTIAAFKLNDLYLGTSWLGSLVDCSDGGQVLSFGGSDVWCGETENGPGLQLKGAAAGRFQQAQMTDWFFPLCEGDGCMVDAHVQRLSIAGGGADGCTGSAFAFNGTKGWMLTGAQIGAGRFNGNGAGVFIDSACDDFNLSNNNLLGNTSNLLNGAGTGARKVVSGNLT